jgi:hypothetical protein
MLVLLGLGFEGLEEGEEIDLTNLDARGDWSRPCMVLLLDSADRCFRIRMTS